MLDHILEAAATAIKKKNKKQKITAHPGAYIIDSFLEGVSRLFYTHYLTACAFPKHTTFAFKTSSKLKNIILK